MIKKFTAICLAFCIIMMSGMSLVAAANLKLSLSAQLTSPNQEGGRANLLRMNDTHIFVSYGTYVEAYSYDKNDPTVAPVYQTTVSYMSDDTDMVAYSMATLDNNYLLVGFVRPAGCTSTAEPRLLIYDVSSIALGGEPTKVGEIALQAYTEGCNVNVEDGVVYLVEWQATHASSAFLWSFPLESAVEACASYEIITEPEQMADGRCDMITDGSASQGSLVTSACMDDGHIYFAQRNRLTVLDVSDRENVIRKGVGLFFDDGTSFSSSTIAAEGDYVYLGFPNTGTSKGGVNVYDVGATKAVGTSEAIWNEEAESTLVAPVRHGEIHYAYQGNTIVVNGILINGDFMYVSYPMLQLIAVYDISDMANFDFTRSELNKRMVTTMGLKSVEGGHDKSVSSGTVDACFKNGGFHSMVLQNGTLYFTDTAYGFRSANITPVEDFSELLVTNGGERVENLEQGELTASFDATNFDGADTGLHVIMALYYDNELESITLQPHTLPAGKKNPVSASIEVPATEDYRLKVMTWDNLEDMNVKSLVWDEEDEKLLATGVDLLPQGNTSSAGNSVTTEEAFAVSEMASDGVITISGYLPSGEGVPVSVLVANTSVDSESDRLSGIRFCDSTVSGAEGAYSFAFKATDGGTYSIKVNGNNGADLFTETIELPQTTLSVRDNYDSPGDASYMQVELKMGRIVTDLSFTLNYDHNTFLVEAVDDIRTSEYFDVVSKEITEPGVITCTLKSKAEVPNDTTAVCTIDVQVDDDAALAEYPMTLSATAEDRLGNEVEMEAVPGSYHIVELSPKKEALRDAVTAINALKASTAIDYANYASEKTAVTNARDKVDAALATGLRITDFDQSVLDKLESAEEKLKEIEAGFAILDLLKDATNDTVDGILESEKEFLGLTDTILSIYDAIPDHSPVWEAIVGKSFASPQAAQKAICESMALAAIHQLDWTDLLHVFETFNTYLGFDLEGDFAQLNDTGKANVFRALAKNNYETPAKARAAFDEAVADAKGKKSSSGSPSGKKTSFVGSAGALLPSGMATSEIPEDYKTASKFTDLDTTPWAAEGISHLFSKGIVSGKANGIFAPNDLITREEFVKLLALGFELENTGAVSNFTDVAENAWYYSYINIACGAGVVSGYDDGSFGVGKTITREDMAVMACRILEHKGKSLGSVNEKIAFNDESEISAYALESVGKMQEAGIINGTGDNMFSPKAGATRAMAAKIIYELLQKMN